MKVQIHIEFVHDCSDFPEGFDRPNRFVAGEEHDVPNDIADYFIRAGWASKPGEEPLKVDFSKPVLVQPDNADHKSSSV